jgi:hypothetical protein
MAAAALAQRSARYQPRQLTPPSPTVAVQTDRTYYDLSVLPAITTGQRVTFHFDVTDLRTLPEKRQYRYEVLAGAKTASELEKLADWQGSTSTPQWEWTTNRGGVYTLAVQYVDRDLNRSKPGVVVLHLVPPWFANAWIVVPSGTGALGLIGWAFVARTLVVRRKREAEELRLGGRACLRRGFSPPNGSTWASVVKVSTSCMISVSISRRPF